MTTSENIDRSPLLPDRHPEPDFFVCDIFDAVPKSDTASMEHPLFTLSTKPDMNTRQYRNGNNWLKIEPSNIGLATVHDRDILIYCISKCMAALNEGKKISRHIRFNCHDLMQVTNRSTGKRGYELLRDSLRRLQGTRIETNITTGGQEQWEMFGLITGVKETRDGRMQALEVTLSDWVFNAINQKSGEILTISRDYFRLRKPLERRLYELARKHCGQNSKWMFKVETLHKRTGSASTLREFRRMIKKIIDDNTQHNHIPDYYFKLEGDTVVIRPRSAFKQAYRPAPSAVDSIVLKTTTYEKARKFAGGWDIYVLEQDWKKMLREKGMPDSIEGSYIGYVKWYVEKNGKAPR